MPDEEKKRLLDMAASLGITTDEFVQASFGYKKQYIYKENNINFP